MPPGSGGTNGLSIFLTPPRITLNIFLTCHPHPIEGRIAPGIDRFRCSLYKASDGGSTPTPHNGRRCSSQSLCIFFDNILAIVIRPQCLRSSVF
ncbi:hypothetical protein D9757_014366 [Collybiopsis confluens]|uniref:Uncharacterized protein n=1 Tax=Collybiopsis confluens TaxID=2823264 RepID=A0A8H5G5S6_9AGAR|nr:hypothetical protein D9757_014366 [Collybiopsis confluens]